MQVETLSTEELGDRSYLVHDGRVAVVVDPQRDIERVTALADRLGVAIGLVLETHIHNDYVTGGYALAQLSGARYAVNAADPVSFPRLPIADGEELAAGTLRVRAMHTPGHTTSHLAFVISDTAHPEQPPAAFTGGSLLYGSVGRTDLEGLDRTIELTHAQFHSARRLAAALPDDAPIFPTHGFGSFCSSGSATGGAESTIGAERGRNDALTAPDEDSFVVELVRNLTAYPAYYAHMAPLNLAGPSTPALALPEEIGPDTLGKRIADGEWVVDLRDGVAYAADHLSGTVSIALGAQFSTYLGWLAPWHSPITLIGDNPAQIQDAQIQLSRIGIDELAGCATGDLKVIGGTGPHASYPRTDFAGALGRVGPGQRILDVRRDDERVSGYIAGSSHIPLNDLIARMGDVPEGRLWVHCASGFRAGIACSLLESAGHAVVFIDDEYPSAEAAGFAMSPGNV